MPTIVREGRFRVKILAPPREHRPPHVHVLVGADGEVVIRLATGSKPARVWQYMNVRESEIMRALEIVEENDDMLRVAWEDLHGQA